MSINSYTPSRGLRPSAAGIEGCENCGVAPLVRFVVPNQTELWRCSACGLYQKGPLPSEESYEQEYHDGYLQALPRKIRTAHVRLCRIEKYLEDAVPTLLDVGCSIGATVAAGERRGWAAYGVDVSRTAVDFCRRQGLNCRQYDGHSLPFANESIDVITSWHVIEHVTNVRSTLADWFRVLRPGGLVILETPHAECWKARLLKDQYRKFWPREHLYTFTPANLTPMVERAGFEPLPTPWIVLPRNVGMVTSAFALAHQSYLAASRLTGFHKSFQIIARRPPRVDANRQAA